MHRLLLSLLVLLLPTSLLAEKTKTFKFTDDFYLKFLPLESAIGPENIGVLMSALTSYAETFKSVWITQIESNLLGGDQCTVDGMALPEFSFCEWKYPGKYDVEVLPLAGQCYENMYGFIQRGYYKIKDLEITCPDNFDFDDLDKDAYVNAAFSGDEFKNLIIATENEAGCGGTDQPACLYQPSETVEVSSPDMCTAELFINRFVDIPIYLKCLTQPYGPQIANKMIVALDEFFEIYITPVLKEKMMTQVPEGFVYSFKSPYDSDRKYCGHGSYYANGYLVEQVPCADGVIITKFMYGFDVIWYKPLTFEGVLLEDEDIPALIDQVFEEQDFLSFLQGKYPDYDFAQDLAECTVIDPVECQATFPPTVQYTSEPSLSLTSPPVAGTNKTLAPTDAAEIITAEPTRFPTLLPTISNSPTKIYEPTMSPTVTAIPSHVPTYAPQTEHPTLNPTGGITETNSKEVTSSPTTTLTLRPTCPDCIIHPDDLDPDKCPIVTTGTCGGGNRGDGVCPYAGYCCSEWGYCGTTSKYCVEGSDNVPTPSIVDGAPPAPTLAIEAGQCAVGDTGDGFCFEENHCCSQYGYCGTGEEYCYKETRTTLDEGADGGGWLGDGADVGTCGGGGIGNGICNDGLCCSKYGFCGEGELYCTGLHEVVDSNAEAEAEEIRNSSPLPEGLKPEFGFRCGITEVDARSNCKPRCTHHTQCKNGEECWGVQLNYCNVFEDIEHPVCKNLDIANTDSRCGFDEAAARGYCGAKCTTDDECGEKEFCYPTLLNLCECHETSNKAKESKLVFMESKSLISPYFVASDALNVVEGIPRNSSFKSSCVFVFMLLALSSMIL